MLSKLRQYPVFLIIVSSFLFRILGMFVSESYKNPREHEMGAMAANILDGKGMSLAYLGPERVTCAFSPFEAYFYALMHGLFGYSEFASALIIATRSAISVATAYIIYRIVRQVFSEKLALLALAATAFYPAFIFYSSVGVHLLRPPFSVFAVSVVVWSLIWFSEHPSKKRAFIVGATLGACSLIQSNVFTFVVFALLWMLYVVWQDNKKQLSWQVLRTVMVMPIALVVIVSPWSLRNYLVCDEIVFLRSGFGTLFWITNNPGTTRDAGSFRLPKERFNVPGVETLSPETLNEVLAASEKGRDKILFREALEYISQNPGQYLAQSLIRFKDYWLGPPKEDRSRAQHIRYLLFSVFSILLMVLAVSALFFRRDRFIVLFYMVILNFTLLYSLTSASYHYYRMDVEPYLLVLALVTLVSLWGRLPWTLKFRQKNQTD